MEGAGQPGRPMTTGEARAHDPSGTAALRSTEPSARAADAAVRSLRRSLDLAGRRLRGLGRALIDVVYPPSCLSCHASTAEPRALCAQCWAKFRLIERPYCERLGTPFDIDSGPGLLSPAAVADPPSYDRGRAVARYDDLARLLARQLKYGDRLDLASTLGSWMARAGAELLRDADLIVPVPLHRSRLFTRRYNQAAVLAEAVSRLSGVKADSFLLARRRATKPQVGLSRAERLSNLSGAFQVGEEAKARLAGLRVLLVDDVLTTGSTVNLAAKALLRGGAKAVDVLVFARVVQDGATPT